MAKQIKYINSAVLVLLACLYFLCTPASATAPTEENPIESTEVSVLDELQYAIDGLLTKYLGSPAISIDEMKLIVNEMDWETYQTARWEISELSSSMTSMVDSGIVTLEALHQLLDNNTLLGEFDAALNAKAASDNSVSTYATNLSLYGGNLSITDDNGYSASGDESSGVTIKTTGNTRTTKTNNITFTNNTSTAKVLRFDYSVSGSYDSYSFSNASGSTVEVTLAANGGTYTCSVTAKKYMSSTATLTLSNFSFEDAASSSSITIYFDSSMGSVTVGGNSATSGVAFNDISTTTETAIVATCGSGITFLGWINEATNTFLSTSASYSQIFGSDVVLTAAFVKSNGSSSAYWGVGAIKEDKTLASDLSGYIYSYSVPEYSAIFDDLSEAYAYAESSANKAVVLLASGTLPAGDYTIPAGVTLLIPYDSANTLCTNKPTLVETYTTPSAYRTLTMTNGANITVNGAISVSGSQSSQYAYNGMPSGPLGFINMNSGSSIVVENGANLYVWGYITGSGSVEVKSGGTVYEDFQVEDYRGGNCTSAMEENTQGVFPMSQYYLQNVEVPMTIHAGAKENAYFSVSVSLVGTQSTTVPVISSAGGGAMFEISSGYIVKDYIEGTGRIKFSSYGDVTLSNMTISLKVSTIGSISIASEDYLLPIPAHFTVDAVSGTVNINQSLALHPGSELYIREGVTATLGSGVNIVAYSWNDWDGFVGELENKYIALGYVPGGGGTTGREKDALIQIDGKLDASAGTAYVTKDGANIYSTGTGMVIAPETSSGTTYQAQQDSNNNPSYVEIDIQSPFLRDGGSGGTEYVQATSEGTYTYYSATQKWCPPGHRYGEGIVTAPTCTEAGYTTNTCIACGNSYTDNETAALGHTEVTDVAVAATCTAAGKTEGKHCSVCSTVLTVQEEVPELGHTEETDAAVAATCTETGLTQGSRCSVCNAVIVAQEVVSATGHTAGTAVIENETDTSYDSVVYCTVCGTEISRETIKTVVYSVTITWSQTSTAKYTEGQTSYKWNTSDLKYTAETTAGGWNNTTSVVEITIDNSNSTGGVEASFSYTPAITSTMTGDALTVGAGASQTSTLTVTPTGDPGDFTNGASITLGTITITLTKEES